MLARGREAKLQNSSGRPPGQMIWTTDFRNKYNGMHSSLCNGFFYLSNYLKVYENILLSSKIEKVLYFSKIRQLLPI